MKRIQLIILFALFFSTGFASVQPELVVKSFGDALSIWCNTNNISYREKIDALCTGSKSCRVEDKLHANYQKGRGLTNYETFVLDSYMNMFQTLMAQNIHFQMSNVKVEATDIMPDGQLSFVTADIKVSGPINMTARNLFLVREGKITGIYNYSSQLGFSHLNGSLIRALKVGRYVYDEKVEDTFGRECAFVNGYAKIRNEAGKCGLIDTHGNIIIPCIWDVIYYYGGALVFGSDDNMEMFKAYDIRFGGKVINNFDYYAAGQTSGNFQNGYMKVGSSDGLYGFLKETDYEYNVEFKYDWIENDFENYALVSEDDCPIIIDMKNFKVVLSSNENYEICGGLHDGLAKVKDIKTERYGFMNINGHLVIPCRFKETDDFSEGLCAVYSEDGKNMGFINKQGNIIVPIVYEAYDGRVKWAHYFKEGYINVRKKTNNKEYGTLINKKGVPLQNFDWRYNEICRFSENKACFKQNGKWGFLNKNGQVVTPAKYDYVSDYHNGYATVMMKVNGINKYGAINHDGVVVVPCIYDNEVTFNNGIALISLNGNIGLIDAYGNSTFFNKK